VKNDNRGFRLDDYQGNQALYDALADLRRRIAGLADSPAARQLEAQLVAIEAEVADIMASLRLTRMPLPDWALRPSGEESADTIKSAASDRPEEEKA
jgi:hypothetical protein